MDVFVRKGNDGWDEQALRFGSRKLDWNDTIARFWRHKATGDMVEVARYWRVKDAIGGLSRRVGYYLDDYTYTDTNGHEQRQILTMEFEQFKVEYEPVGNMPIRPGHRDIAER